jgi:16S rRNA (guanine1516-N2)-methyltransferase
LAKAHHLNLAKTAGCNVKDPYSLYLTEQRLELIYHHKSITHRIFTDFLKGPLGYRRLKGGGRNQTVARAVGFKSNSPPITILDATAGLGADAFVFAALGSKVHLIERSPIIAALLLDGLNRAQHHKEVAHIIQNMHVSIADAQKILSDLTHESGPDVVYLDPMFPATQKNTLNKIKMRILRDIVGDDLDAPQLLSLAIEKAKTRVVIKRPRNALPLPGIAPNFFVKGNSNRYDIYLTKCYNLRT